MPLVLRPATPKDDPFLLALYATTREDELSLVDWGESEKDAFVRMQYTAQKQHYETHFPQMEYELVELEGQRIGRLIVADLDDELRLLDIALLPDYRNRGMGSELMQRLMERAAAAGKSVRGYVDSVSPAVRFYERLGFTKLEETGVYTFMGWQPNVTPSGL